MFKFDTTFAYHRLSHSGVGTRELDSGRSDLTSLSSHVHESSVCEMHEDASSCSALAAGAAPPAACSPLRLCRARLCRARAWRWRRHGLHAAELERG